MPSLRSSATPRLDSCVVCGSSDARTLSTTPLASGDAVVVCGSHAVAHARAVTAARDVSELRARFGERRAREDRRGAHTGEADELAQALAAAFTAERRGLGRRSADA